MREKKIESCSRNIEIALEKEKRIYYLLECAFIIPFDILFFLFVHSSLYKYV
jgi:hypothetical protein